MSAYFVASYTVTNEAGYEPYVPAVLPTLMASGAEVLVADYDSEVIEGEPHTITVVLRFESKAAAHGWYGSAEYQAIKHHRLDHSDGTAVLVNEFVMPG